MNVNIDADVIEKAVTEAIVASAIGAKIKVAVSELLGKSYNNPIQKSIEQVITELALKVVRDEYDQQIREAVRAKMQDEAVADIVARLWDSWFKSRER